MTYANINNFQEIYYKYVQTYQFFFGTSLKSNLQNKSCIHLDSFSTPTLLKTQRAQTINVSEMPLHVLRLTFRSNISTYIHTYIQCGCYIDMGKKSVL